MRILYRILSSFVLALALNACVTIREPAQALLPTPGAYTASIPKQPTDEKPPDEKSPKNQEIPTPAPTGHPSTPTLPPSPVTALPVLRRLTADGCCVNPYFSADSQRILFIDRPSPSDQAGIWGVNVAGGEVEFISERLGIFSEDQTLRAFPSSDQTLIEQLKENQRWLIPNGGRPVVFSPDNSRVAWTAGNAQPPFDSALRQIWISHLDGSGSQSVAEVLSAGISGWFPDGRLLISGRLETESNGQAVWIFAPPENGEGEWQPTEIARGERLRGAVLSPGGSWLAYLSTFSGNPEQDGLWLLNTSTLDRRKLDIFGAYRWRDPNHLLIVPLRADQSDHQILQVDAENMGVEEITNPAITPFKISNGDWTVSPDGRYVAFISAHDQSIWLIDLGSV